MYQCRLVKATVVIASTVCTFRLGPDKGKITFYIHIYCYCYVILPLSE